MERFKDLEWVGGLKNLPPIIIGGVGGIGSYLALYLSRQELDLILFDNDIIDNTNMSGQHYFYNEINTLKTEAIAKQIKDFSDIDVETYGFYDKNSVASPIMFSAFDNMKARKIMFHNWKSQEDRMIYIDGRLNAESFEIYLITPKNEDKYENKYLFDDEEAEEPLCTMKATTHCGAIIAGFMTAGFVNYVTNTHLKFNMRELPFKLSYDLELFNQTIYEI